MAEVALNERSEWILSWNKKFKSIKLKYFD